MRAVLRALPLLSEARSEADGGACEQGGELGGARVVRRDVERRHSRLGDENVWLVDEIGRPAGEHELRAVVVSVELSRL